jgi:hypothetical protein
MHGTISEPSVIVSETAYRQAHIAVMNTGRYAQGGEADGGQDWESHGEHDFVQRSRVSEI